MFPVQILQDLGTAEAFETALHIIVEPFQRLSSQEPGGNTESENRKFEFQNGIIQWRSAKVATILCCLSHQKVEFISLLLASGLAHGLWPQRAMEVRLCESGGLQLPPLLPLEVLQPVAM